MNRLVIYPTKWPLLEFFFGIWKFRLNIFTLRPSIESLTYEYIVLLAYWGSKEIFRFRLYDSEKRMSDRLSPLISSSKSVYTKEELKQIQEVVEEELKKYD